MDPVPAPGEAPLPPGLRRVTLAALVLAGTLGFGAAQDMAQLYASAPQAAELEVSQLPAFPGVEQQPEVYRSAFKALLLAQFSALESMRGSRTLILFGLWLASSMLFVSSLRMVRPRGAPREGVRRLLATTMVVSAVLRTLDGAQLAAIANRAGRAFDKVLLSSTELPGGWFDGLAANTNTARSVFASFVVCGALLLLSRYYRSDRVRDVTTGLDAKN